MPAKDSETPTFDIPDTTLLSREQKAAQLDKFQRLSHKLTETFPSQIALRGQKLFKQSVSIFNDAAPLGAWMVALPTTAQEISILVKFCTANQLSPSIKSGGFATAGWAIQGELVIDTRHMDHVKLIAPKLPADQQQNGSITIPTAGLAPLATIATAPSGPSFQQPEIHAENHASDVAVVSDSISIAVTEHNHDPKGVPIQNQVTALDAGSSEALRSSSKRAREADDASPAVDAGSSCHNSSFTRRKADDGTVLASTKNLKQSPSLMHEDESMTTNGAWTRLGKELKALEVENGADADSEGLSGSHKQGKEASYSPQPTRSSETNAESPRGYMTASVPTDQAPFFGKDSGSARRSTNWVDRQLDRSGHDLSSPSASGSPCGSSSHQGNSMSSTTHSSHSGRDSADSGKEALGAGRGASSAAASFIGAARRSESPMMVDGQSSAGTRPSYSRAASLSGSASGSARGRLGSNSQTPDDWDPNSSFEHQRWQKHHRPSGTPSERVKLPPGGFVWRSDADGITSMSSEASGLPWDSSAFAATHNLKESQDAAYNVRTSGGMTFDLADPTKPPSFGASTLANLQEAWPAGTWAYNPTAAADNNSSSNLPRFIPSPLQTFAPALPSADEAATNPYVFGSRPAPPPSSVVASILSPGVHEDKYALVSFGPGAGIRGLDAFTDRAGRQGEFCADQEVDGKGKEAAKTDKTLVVNGVPYHVPVSAYPVGSTAMTTGGFGYLTRAYGLSLDNIVEVEMVLADGRIITLNDQSKNKSEEERDLWWAVRGAAPCFGIVSRITAKAYPVPSVYSGNLIFPLNPATASSLIRHWRDCLKAELPNSFYSNLILTAGPSKTSHVIVIQVCFLGPKNEGEPLVQAISSWSGERLLLKDVEERSFLSQQDGVAKVLKGGSGRRWMIRGDLISTLTDELISQSVKSFQGLGSRAVWLFELLGGAVQNVVEEDSCIASEARAAKFTVGSLQQWSGQEEDERCIESVESWLNNAVGKVSIGGPYPCFLGRSEKANRVVGSYGVKNMRRMLELKRKVDPSGLFRHTFGNGLVDFDEKVLKSIEEDAARKPSAAM